MRFIVTTTAFTSLLVLSSCTPFEAQLPGSGSGSSTTPATPATPATTATTATSTSTAGTGSVAATDELQLALTIHVERRDTEVNNEAEFGAHVATLETLSDLAATYDVILNFELSSAFVEAIDQWGSTFIEDMTAIGHGISQHSGDQTTAGLTGEARVAELTEQREAIEGHGVTVTYVSGACSTDDDWVESAVAAGFSAVTGITEYCLASLDDATLPDGMEWIRDCTNPSICHDPIHVGTERMLHPWTTSTSAGWLNDDPSGGLVIVSADDATGFVTMSQTGEADLATSLEQWIEMLDTYTSSTVDGQLNVLNTVLSIGPEPEWEVVEAMFAEAQARQDAGELTWALLSDLVAQAVAEAPTQASDPAVVYTDTSSDLGGGLPAGGGSCRPPACKPTGGTLP